MNAPAKHLHNNPTDARPAMVIPTVRQPEFDLADDVPKYWWDNDPLKTLLLGALSASFPAGERFFIDSVRHFQDQISDPELKKSRTGLYRPGSPPLQRTQVA